MKVYGQLERAQIEVLASDPTGADLVAGRMWFRSDTTRFKVYDGAATQEFVDLIAAQTLQNKIIESGQLNTPTIQGASTVNELGATPANPAAGNHKLYYKNDGELYTLDSAGVEEAITGGQGTITYVTKNANATLLDSETYADVTVGASDVTITLPATPANGQRHIIRKVDAGAGSLIVAGTIDGQTNFYLHKQYNYGEFIYNGAAWNVKNLDVTDYRQVILTSRPTTVSADTYVSSTETLTLEEGTWEIGYFGCLRFTAQGGGSITPYGVLRLFDDTNTAALADSYVTVFEGLTASNTRMHSVSQKLEVTLTAETDFTLDVAASLANTAVEVIVEDSEITGLITGDENTSRVWARRIR